MSQSNFAPLTSSTQENLLTPAEVAALFRVDPKTVTRWAKAGKLTSIRTLGGNSGKAGGAAPKMHRHKAGSA